jgi:hypothetical protein
VGVYKIPNQPKGPDLEINKYTISPTTTGGSPIIVLKKINIMSLPQKFLIARKVPKGNPTKQEKNNEKQLTLSESNNISNKSAFKVDTNSNDCLKASNKIFI